MRRYHAGLAVVILVALWVIFCMPVPRSAAEQRKVTMILWDGITPNEEGFQDGLREAGYDVAFEIFDVHGDTQELSRVLQQLQPASTQLFYVSTTTVLKAALERFRQAPVIFRIDSHAVTHDMGAQLKKTHPNITGICNGVQFAMQQRGMEKLVNIKRFGMIYDPTNEEVVADRNFLRRLAEREQFTLVDVGVSEPARIAAAVEKLAKAKVDVLYLPPDPFVMRHSKAIATLATQWHIPTLTGIERLVLESGVLFALASNRYELGKIAALQADQIFKGESPANIPVEHSFNFAPVINLETAKALDMKSPISVLLAAKKVKGTHSH
jgi:putative ABC transport system substrate-binding protein